jgi:hypothetical protein
MTSKIRKVEAAKNQNTEPKYALSVIRSLRQQGHNDRAIARLCGVHVRTVYRSLEVGFVKYPVQVTFELLAGLR